MGLVYRRRVKISPSRWLNVSGKGVSVSQRAGNVTMSSRGRGSVRLLPGLSWRFRWHK